MKRVLPIALMALAAIASAGVIPTEKGTFVVAKKRPQAGTATPAALTEAAQSEAREYCAKDQKAVEPAGAKQSVKYEKGDDGREHPVVVEVSLEFRCLAK